MKPKIQIEGRDIGYDYDPLVIVEIGINHAGSLETAFKMVKSMDYPPCGTLMVRNGGNKDISKVSHLDLGELGTKKEN